MNEHLFSQEAMNTTFSLRFQAKESDAAASIARECFEKLEYLENKLSRYIEGSDIWQINHLNAGEQLFISEDCHQCLVVAMEACAQTGGLFDVSLGRQVERLKNSPGSSLPELTGRIVIDPKRPLVHCESPGREVDLGGIGKGFALDVLKAVLTGWGIESGLIAAGSSTQLAFGNQPWRVQITGDHASSKLDLQNAALSASGIAIQGCHILSPREGFPTHPYKRLWILAPDATQADIWSTAAMLMSPEEIPEILPPALCCLAEINQQIQTIAPL